MQATVSVRAAGPHVKTRTGRPGSLTGLQRIAGYYSNGCYRMTFWNTSLPRALTVDINGATRGAWNDGESRGERAMAEFNGMSGKR